jgi:para-nitrobenzyl esterase
MAIEMFGDGADEYIGLCKAQLGNIDEVRKKASVSSIEYAIRIIGQANANIPLYYYNFDAEIPGWDNPGTFHSVDI